MPHPHGRLWVQAGDAEFVEGRPLITQRRHRGTVQRHLDGGLKDEALGVGRLLRKEDDAVGAPIVHDVLHAPATLPGPGASDDCAQALPWVSIFVVSIFPPNILGQSTFALSQSRREDSYLKYPTMWVLDTHSSHKILMQGYFAKLGTTSR